MAKKSKRLAAQRSASTKRKKGKGGLSQRQIELSGVAAPAPTPEQAPEAVESPDSAADPAATEAIAAEAPPVAQPLPTQPKAAVAAEGPWRYGYVLGDMKRIGLMTSVVAVLLVVLTFILR